MRRVVTALVMVTGLAFFSPEARAQEGEEAGGDESGLEGIESEDDGASEEDSALETDAEAEAFLAGEEEEPEIEAPEEEQGLGREEPEGMHFWMVGGRWRLIFVPAWLLDAFMDFPQPRQPPRAVYTNAGAGAEFTWRRNRLSIIGALWWASYSTHGERFVAEEAGSTDDPEFVWTDIHLLWFTVDFIHSYMFTDWIGITYGAGLGLGVRLAGGLWRHEAKLEGDDWVECETNDSDALCESDGFYNAKDDVIWPVYPWINLLLGIRFKVFRHMEINVEGGVGLGFLFGMRINYIF